MTIHAEAEREGAAVVFQPLFPDVVPPERATEGSAGYDLRAHVSGRSVRVSRSGRVTEREVAPLAALEIAPGETALVPLGFRARLPAGFEAQIRIRSSVAFRKGLTVPNAPGTIDSDYPDEWLVMLRNDSSALATITHGERIAQAVIARYSVAEWETGSVAPSTRSGGLGSTG